jgi:hypothetical protein
MNSSSRVPWARRAAGQLALFDRRRRDAQTHDEALTCAERIACKDDFAALQTA